MAPEQGRTAVRPCRTPSTRVLLHSELAHGLAGPVGNARPVRVAGQPLDRRPPLDPRRVTPLLLSRGPVSTANRIAGQRRRATPWPAELAPAAPVGPPVLAIGPAAEQTAHPSLTPPAEPAITPPAADRGTPVGTRESLASLDELLDDDPLDDAPENHAPDNHAPDNHAPDNHAPDNHTPGNHAGNAGGETPSRPLAPVARLRPAAKRRMLVAGFAAAVLIAVLSTYLIARRGGSPQAAPAAPSTATRVTAAAPASPAGARPTPTLPVADLAPLTAWLAGNVAPATTMSADAGLAQTLRQNGASGAHPLNTAWRGDTYVVSTPALRATSSAPVAQALASSVPVARFGSGAEQVEVRRVVTGNVVALLATDRADRLQAGSELTQNPALVIDPAPRARIVTGVLDMRATVLLTLLATHTQVHVHAVVSDPAEAAAGLPDRVLTLSLDDPSALAVTMAQLPPSYRPAPARTTADGGYQLTWPIAIAPVRSAS